MPTDARQDVRETIERQPGILQFLAEIGPSVGLGIGGAALGGLVAGPPGAIAGGIIGSLGGETAGGR